MKTSPQTSTGEAGAPPTGGLRSVVRTLERWGGFFVSPGTHAASLSPHEGRRDALWLGLLYVAGTSLYGLVEAFANLVVVRNMGGVLSVLAEVGRIAIAPILTLVVVETVLGAERSYRRGIGLLPLVVFATVAHAATQMGVDLGLPTYAPEIAGGLLGAGLARWIRPNVAPLEDDQ